MRMCMRGAPVWGVSRLGGPRPPNCGAIRENVVAGILWAFLVAPARLIATRLRGGAPTFHALDNLDHSRDYFGDGAQVGGIDRLDERALDNLVDLRAWITRKSRLPCFILTREQRSVPCNSFAVSCSTPRLSANSVYDLRSAVTPSRKISAL